MAGLDPSLACVRSRRALGLAPAKKRVKKLANKLLRLCQFYPVAAPAVQNVGCRVVQASKLAGSSTFSFGGF